MQLVANRAGSFSSEPEMRLRAGDLLLLRIVLENLLANAWKFTGKIASARIEIGSAVTGGVTSYFVRDNGVGFDPAYAESIGLRPSLLRYTLLALLALTVVTAIQAVGVVLTNALLITPAAAASLLTVRLPRMMLLAVLFAIASALAGLFFSYHLRVSSGAAIVLTCTALFGLAWVGRALRLRRRRAADPAGLASRLSS